MADPRVLAANDALLDQLIEHGDAADGVPLSDQLKDKMDQIGVPEGPVTMANRLSLYRRGRTAADAHASRLAHAREARKQVERLKMGGSPSRSRGFLT